MRRRRLRPVFPYHRLVTLVGIPLLLGLPRPAHAADTVIVKYRSGVTSVQRHDASRRAGVVATVGRVRGQGARVVRVNGDAASAARRLAASRGVLYAEPNYRMHVARAPDDPLYPRQSDLAAIHVASGWETLGLGSFPAGGGVPVGIVDTGIDSGHEDLAGNLLDCGGSFNGVVTDGSCEDDNDHGTHVAGTIGAQADNGAGIAGVAFNSPLVMCKALDLDGSGSLADVASCVSWVRSRGAKVISLSVGGPSSVTLRNAVRAVWAAGGRSGAVIVAAAGNDGDGSTEYPAGYPEVVSVAAVHDSGAHASFSNSNPDVEVAAPGVDVLSTKRGGGYMRLSGTSMATPHAAGLAALLWDAHRRASASTIRARLDAATDDLGAPGRDPQFGFGLIDAAKVGG